MGNNQVLVPVTLKNRGKIIRLILLLDTGASITTISETAAQALEITKKEASAAQVAGGGIIRTWRAQVDEMQVGPKSMGPKTIMILPGSGGSPHYQGLLGQDFLGRFRYTLDQAQQIIQWAE